MKPEWYETDKDEKTISILRKILEQAYNMTLNNEAILSIAKNRATGKWVLALLNADDPLNRLPFLVLEIKEIFYMNKMLSIEQLTETITKDISTNKSLKDVIESIKGLKIKTSETTKSEAAKNGHNRRN